MTEDEAYKVHIQYTFNAFCKTVIRHAAIDKILKLRRKWEREVSLDYLMNEKFVQLAEPEQLEEYLFTACGQTAVLYHAELADALNEYGAPYNALSGEVRAVIADLAALKYEVLKKVGDAVGNTQAYQL